MARRHSILSETEGGDDNLVNVSPLIDIVFILLIFFVVTTVFVDRSGIEVNRPEAATARETEDGALLFAIGADGTVVFGGREVDLRLVRTLVEPMAEEDRRMAVIEVDRETPADPIVRLMDELYLSGVGEISLAADKPEGASR